MSSSNMWDPWEPSPDLNSCWRYNGKDLTNRGSYALISIEPDVLTFKRGDGHLLVLTLAGAKRVFVPT